MMLKSNMTPPKYPRTFHLPFSPGVQSDDKIIPDISPFIGCEISITEKMDRGCTILSQGEVWSRASVVPAIEKWFSIVRKWHGWKTANLPETHAIYVEDLYGKHSIAYAILESETFRPFHYLNGDVFLHPDEMSEKDS